MTKAVRTGRSPRASGKAKDAQSALAVAPTPPQVFEILRDYLRSLKIASIDAASERVIVLQWLLNTTEWLAYGPGSDGQQLFGDNGQRDLAGIRHAIHNAMHWRNGFVPPDCRRPLMQALAEIDSGNGQLPELFVPVRSPGNGIAPATADSMRRMIHWYLRWRVGALRRQKDAGMLDIRDPVGEAYRELADRADGSNIAFSQKTADKWLEDIIRPGDGQAATESMLQLHEDRGYSGLPFLLSEPLVSPGWTLPAMKRVLHEAARPRSSSGGAQTTKKPRKVSRPKKAPQSFA